MKENPRATTLFRASDRAVPKGLTSPNEQSGFVIYRRLPGRIGAPALSAKCNSLLFYLLF